MVDAGYLWSHARRSVSISTKEPYKGALCEYIWEELCIKNAALCILPKCMKEVHLQKSPTKEPYVNTYEKNLKSKMQPHAYYLSALPHELGLEL